MTMYDRFQSGEHEVPFQSWPKIPRLLRETGGEIAVVYSRGYGIGWSNAARGDRKTAMTLAVHSEIATLVRAGLAKEHYNAIEIIDAVRRLLPGFETKLLFDPREYTDFHRQPRGPLSIEWVPVGWLFEIEDYNDGMERVRMFNPYEHYFA